MATVLRMALIGLAAGYFWGHVDGAASARPAPRPARALNRHGPLPGRWSPLRESTRLRRELGASEVGAAHDGDAAWEALRQLGYAAGSEPVRERGGVILLDASRAEPGLDLWTSGHAEVAYLSDLRGEVLHTWSFDIDSQLPPERRARFGFRRWRRAQALPDGGLLAIYEGHFLIKLDRDSRLQWLHDGGAHHDLHVGDDGTIHVLTRSTHVIPELDPARPCLEDFVSVLDADGTELRRISILEAFLRSDHAAALAPMASHGDLMHTNTIEVLDGSLVAHSPAFAAGNLLLSLRELDLLAILDPRSERIVWTLGGLWHRQHQPTLLPDGELLVFDNHGPDGFSRVLQLDPATQAIRWRYDGDEANGFFSAECGSAQRLDNGNTLITETNSGRAFEVTPGGELVWEFHNPHTAGDDDEYVASLFEVVRLPPDFGATWLGQR